MSDRASERAQKLPADIENLGILDLHDPRLAISELRVAIQTMKAWCD